MVKRQSIDPQQKALEINLKAQTYGSFAEIGAGQEVAAHFFKAGGASGTIAKTISAYDMTFSDAIYGAEQNGRYVCESRLIKMLNREFNLLQQRLKGIRPPDTLFFAFADTMVALNFKKTNEGHGWIGLRFQLHPNDEPNDVIMHVWMHDNSNVLQQRAVGILGVNLIYACFNYTNNIDTFLDSLMDHLSSDRIEIDMMRLTGPDFKHVDNRLISLQLVKKGFTNAALFDPKGNVLQPAEAFYKRNILLLRGRFRPCTYVNVDMLSKGLQQFRQEKSVESEKIVVVSELTLTNLKSDGEINEKDFLDRTEILCSLGQTVLISNYHEYYRLISYLSRYTKQKIGVILGLMNLYDIFNEEYYTNLKGGILESFATLFSRNVKMYIYPSKHPDTGKIQTCDDFNLPPTLVDLFRYLQVNDKIDDLKGANSEYLSIYSDHVLDMIRENKSGWEEFVPQEVSSAIIEKKLFGYQSV